MTEEGWFLCCSTVGSAEEEKGRVRWLYCCCFFNIIAEVRVLILLRVAHYFILRLIFNCEAFCKLFSFSTEVIVSMVLIAFLFQVLYKLQPFLSLSEIFEGKEYIFIFIS